MGNNIKDFVKLMPGAIYLKDTCGYYLCCSDYMYREAHFTHKSDIVGKTDYDLFPKELADKLRSNDLTVIETGKELIVEESISVPGGERKFFQAIKVPLKNNKGIVIGILGNSIDITYRKKGESLKLETELQKKQLYEQERFRKIVDQAVHDIRSPLAALLMIVKSCEKELPEKTRIALREAAISIGDIANNLLSKYKGKDQELLEIEKQQPIILALTLLQVLGEKKYQYRDMDIQFIQTFTPNCNFTVINAKYVSFKRMISNIINNAVDALNGEIGKISLRLDVKDQEAIIIIEDTGKGIPQETINKIINRVSVTAGKKEGYGIGFSQIWETIEHNQGRLAIKSKIGKGTKIILTFPIIETPDWLLQKLDLNRGDIVVILDDDNSIHHAWKSRFKVHNKDIILKHFMLGEEVIDFINNYSEKEKILLLTDFELLKQEFNGIQIVEKTKIKRVVLVTSHHANTIVQNFVIKNKIKILPKLLAPEVVIKINTNPEKCKNADT